MAALWASHKVAIDWYPQKESSSHDKEGWPNHGRGDRLEEEEGKKQDQQRSEHNEENATNPSLKDRVILYLGSLLVGIALHLF